MTAPNPSPQARLRDKVINAGYTLTTVKLLLRRACMQDVTKIEDWGDINTHVANFLVEGEGLIDSLQNLQTD